jgi:hypothetical protein
MVGKTQCIILIELKDICINQRVNPRFGIAGPRKVCLNFIKINGTVRKHEPGKIGKPIAPFVLIDV